jgi:purine-cytosine permease-like protein
MSTSTPEIIKPYNYLAIISLVLGILGLVVALTAPIPFVPLISAFTWPFGLVAILASRAVKKNDDPTAQRQAKWGVRLGCMGWIIQFITSVVKLTIFIGLVVAGVQSLLGLQPTSIP